MKKTVVSFNEDDSIHTMAITQSDNAKYAHSANACKIICISQTMTNEHVLAIQFVLVRQFQMRTTFKE